MLDESQEARGDDSTLRVDEDPDGVYVYIRVSPRAGRDEVVGIRHGALHVRLKAPPVEDKANKALISFLSARFDLPRSAIRLVSGHKSRDKRVMMKGITKPDLVRLIKPGLSE